MDENVEEVKPSETSESAEDPELPELITAVFPDEASARAAFQALRDLQKDQEVLLADLAIVVREGDNDLRINEPDDMTAPEGAIYGGTIGAVIGMIAGPLGLVIGGAIGALVGGAATQAGDSQIDNDWLENLGQSLQPGTGMVVAVAPALQAAEVSATLASLGGNVNDPYRLYGSGPADIPEELDDPEP